LSQSTSSPASHSSSTLSYKVYQPEFRQEIVESVKRLYDLDIGKAYVYRVLVSFRTKTGWTDSFTLIYDTGAVVSLLPAMFYNLLRVEKSAPIKLSGIAPEVEVKARLTRASLRLHDAQGKTSPALEAWVAIADGDNVPLILGLKDVSDTHDFRVDSKKKMFYLDFD
jgi:hypothetical protein